MMVDNLPVKEIKRSLEVVAVFADHPKLNNHFLGLENNNVYALYLISHVPPLFWILFYL